MKSNIVKMLFSLIGAIVALLVIIVIAGGITNNNVNISNNKYESFTVESQEEVIVEETKESESVSEATEESETAKQAEADNILKYDIDGSKALILTNDFIPDSVYLKNVIDRINIVDDSYEHDGYIFIYPESTLTGLICNSAIYEVYLSDSIVTDYKPAGSVTNDSGYIAYINMLNSDDFIPID